MRRRRVGLLGVLSSVVLAAIVTSSLLNTALGPSVTYTVHLSYSGGQLSEQISTWSRYSANIGRADYLTEQIPSISTVYYYYDPAYPASYSDEQYWFGLSQLIAQLATERSMPLHIVMLNANDLATFLEATPPPDSILVMASGVLPDTVFGPHLNEVVPWIRVGGVLVWAGDLIGAYSGARGTDGGPGTLLSMGWNGTTQFLNRSYLGTGGSLYLNQSVYSKAFGFLYSLSLGPLGQFNVTGVTAIGGVPLGLRAGNFTNLAAIPEGAGRLIDFAGPLWDLNALVQTLMNGIQSGAFLFPLSILANPVVQLQANQQLVLHATYPLSAPETNASRSTFCTFAYEQGTFAQFARLSCLPLT